MKRAERDQQSRRRTEGADVVKDMNVPRRQPMQRWFSIEFGAVTTLVTTAWIDEPGSLERLALTCACWAPFLYGAVVWARSRWRFQGR